MPISEAGPRSNIQIPQELLDLGIQENNIRKSTDLLPRLQFQAFKLAHPGLFGLSWKEENEEFCSKAIELTGHIKNFQHFELTQDKTTLKDLLFIEDSDGKKAVIFICRDKKSKEVIGGCGVYPDKSIAEMEKRARLYSRIMQRKNRVMGIPMGGGKAIIMAGTDKPGESDWELSRFLQRATGFAFSDVKNIGVIPKMTTGADSGQTERTLANMALGSKIAEDNKVAGLIKGLETPYGCKYSALEVHRTLFKNRKILGQYGFEIPNTSGSKVSVEGCGNVGHFVAEGFLEAGNHITTADVILDNVVGSTQAFSRLEEKRGIIQDLLSSKREETFLQRIANLTVEQRQLLQEVPIDDLWAGENEGNVERSLGNLAKKLEVMHNFKQLEAKASERGVTATLVTSDALPDYEANIFCPCSNKALLDPVKIERLKSKGVKLILSGQNNPCGENTVWEYTNYAANKGICMVADMWANGGGVLFASREREYQQGKKEDKTLTPQRFIEKTLIPHIHQVSESNLTRYLEILDRYKIKNLALATEIDYLESQHEFEEIQQLLSK